MGEQYVSREEFASLLTTMENMAGSLARIEATIGRTLGKRKLTRADLDAREEMRKNNSRLRQLAEQARAELDARKKLAS